MSEKAKVVVCILLLGGSVRGFGEVVERFAQPRIRIRREFSLPKTRT